MNALRFCIAGLPRAGKTTLARWMAATSGVPLHHTDSLTATHGWSEASAEVSRWLSATGPWIVEGVSVPRAVRKWLAFNPAGSPADVAIFLTQPRVALSTGQSWMGKGCVTVWSEIQDELVRRGTAVVVI